MVIPNGVSPATKSYQLSQVVQNLKIHRNLMKHVDCPQGLVAHRETIGLTVDSGACDAVCPPHSFSNTHLNTRNSEFGKPHGACGGETVRNIGSKTVKCLTSGGVSNYVFQVGDKLTKPLLAVSKI